MVIPQALHKKSYFGTMLLLFGQQNHITYVTVLGRAIVGQKLQMTDDGIADS